MTIAHNDSGLRRLDGDMCGLRYVQKRSKTNSCNVVATIYCCGRMSIRYNASYVSEGVFPMAPPLHTRASLTALALSVTAFATLIARQPPPAPAGQPAQPAAQQQQPPAAPPPKPLVPVATNTVNANPD